MTDAEVDVNLLVPARVLRMDEHVHAWHSGLVSSNGWVSISAIIDRLGSGGSENLRPGDLKEMFKAAIVHSDSGEVVVKLWRGGMSGMTPLAAHYFEQVRLPSGNYVLNIAIDRPSDVACDASYEFVVE
jgi:hypothetical protein